MNGPPFVSPVRIGTAAPGQPGALVTGSLALLFDPAQVTLTYDPNVISTGDGASITGAIRVELLGVAPLPTYPSVNTVNGTLTPLATLPPCPAGGTQVAQGFVFATLGPGQVNANAPVAGGDPFWSVVVKVGRVGTAAPSSGTTFTGNASPSAPFTNAWPGSTTPGSIVAAITGNSLMISVVGFTTKEPWTTGHTYSAGNGTNTPGDFVTSSGGVYLCTTGGVAGASAPTGTGTGISDGTDVWAYVGPANGSQVPVRWTFALTSIAYSG